jgi:hypothetical protein
MFYVLVMQRLLYRINKTLHHKSGQYSTPLTCLCNQLGLSQSDFICSNQHFHAVLRVRECHERLVLPNSVDLSITLFLS